jgi:hypothetical protein
VWHKRGVLVFLAATSLGCAACGSVGHGGLRVGSGPSSTSVSQPSSTVFSLPSGYLKPYHVAGDSHGQGVWFFSENGSDARVFHWNGTQLSSWSIGNANSDDLLTGIQNAITIAPDGSIWIGVNSTLIHFDPSTSASTKMVLPQPSDSTAAEQHRPSIIQGVHAIQSISVAPNNHVAVARDAAAAVQVVDGTAGSVDAAIPLPAGTAPTEVAYSHDGSTLAVGLWNAKDSSDDEVLISHGDGGSSPTQIVSAGSYSVHADESGFVVARDEDGVVHELTTSGSQTNRRIGPADDRLVVGGDAYESNGYLVVPLVSGVVVQNVTTNRVTNVHLPQFNCGGASVVGGGSNAQASSGTVMCDQTAVASSVDGAGNVWFVPSGPDNGIGVVAASEYS